MQDKRLEEINSLRRHAPQLLSRSDKTGTNICAVLAAGEQRLEHLLHGRPLFCSVCVNGRVPDTISAKLEVLEGDLSMPDCRPTKRQLALLRSKVDWFIYTAASISFFDHIYCLLEQNYSVSHVPTFGDRATPNAAIIYMCFLPRGKVRLQKNCR